MATTTIAAKDATGFDPAAGPATVEEQKKEELRRRMRRIEGRLLAQTLAVIFFTVLLWFSLWRLMGPAFDAHRTSAALLMVAFLIVPTLAVEWMNWRSAHRAVSDMWAFGDLRFDELSRLLAGGKAVAAEIGDSHVYIDVLHEHDRTKKTPGAIHRKRQATDRNHQGKRGPQSGGGGRHRDGAGDADDAIAVEFRPHPEPLGRSQCAHTSHSRHRYHRG
jgi:hypothetical protein